MRKLLVRLMLALVILLTLIAPASAVGLETGVVQKVAPTQTIDDDLVISGESVTIDGTVNGDVFAGASTLVVNGLINGNLFVSAGSVEIRGKVTGSVIFLGQNLAVKGRVERNLVTLGSTVVVDQAGSIGHSVIGAEDRLEILGNIERGMMAASSNITVNGRIGQELRARAQQLTIGSSAAIVGPVTYAGESAARIAPGATTGPVTYHRVTTKTAHWFLSPWLIALKFGGFLAFGLAILALLPRLRTEAPDLILRKPWQTVLAGFLVLIATPIAAILLMVTVIGLPLGILLLIAYPVLIYTGQVLIAWACGHWLTNRVPALQGQTWITAFLLGALLTTLLTQLPIVGGILVAAAIFFGLGGLWLLFVERRAI